MKAKDSEDMSMEEILASIRQYVSATNETNKKSDKKSTTKSSEEQKIVSLNEKQKPEVVKSEAKDLANIEDNQKALDENVPIATKLQKLKALKKEKVKKEGESINRDFNILSFVEQTLNEKIQEWIDTHLEDIVKDRIDDVLEKVTSEQINNILQEDE